MTKPELSLSEIVDRLWGFALDAASDDFRGNDAAYLRYKKKAIAEALHSLQVKIDAVRKEERSLALQYMEGWKYKADYLKKLELTKKESRENA